MTACAIFSCHIGGVAQVAIRRILSTAIRTTQAGCSTCTCIYPTITTIGWVRLLPLLPVRFTNGDHYKELSLHKLLLQCQQYDVGAWGVYAMKWTESSPCLITYRRWQRHCSKRWRQQWFVIMVILVVWLTHEKSTIHIRQNHRCRRRRLRDERWVTSVFRHVILLCSAYAVVLTVYLHINEQTFLLRLLITSCTQNVALKKWSYA